MKRTNTPSDALNRNKAVIDPGDGLPLIELPLDGNFGGGKGDPGEGVPTGGAPLQVVRKNVAGTATEWATLTKATVGLDQVANTADADKPISTATQAALDTKASTGALAGKASLVDGKVPLAQLPTDALITDTNVAAQIDAPATGAAIDNRINAQVSPVVQQITADYIAGDQAVVDAAAAAVNASPKIQEIEAREMPNRGRATLALFPGGIDSMVTQGTYSVWSGADAVALGVPTPNAIELEVFTYGNIVHQRYWAWEGAGWVEKVRRKAGAIWERWSTPNQKMKTVPIALTTSGPISTNTTEVVHARVPIKIAVRASRWRIHFRNYNFRMWAAYNGSLSFLGAAFGPAAKQAGELTGQFTVAPTPIMGAVTTPNLGQEWVSDWVTAPIEAHTDYLFSYAYTSPSGQVNFTSVGGGWQSAESAAWANQTDGTLAKTGTLPLDIWVEVEVPAETKVVAYVGDSLTAGVGAGLPVYDSYPNRHALAHNVLPINYGFSGDALNGYTNSAQPKLTKWSSQAAPNALVWSLGSNDVFLGATIAEMRSRFTTAFSFVSNVTSGNLYLTTILPRYEAHAAYESVRKEWNEILRTELPGNAVMCFDAAEALEDPSGDLLDLRWGASLSDFHLNRAGYARFAAQVPSIAS